MFKITELAMTVCNGKYEVWEDREEAKDFFIRQMMITEGEEHDRCECIYIQLIHRLSGVFGRVKKQGTLPQR